MENTAFDISDTASACPTCYRPLTSSEKFCSDCGYPAGGTDEEKDTFHSRYMGIRAQYQSCMQEALKGTKNLYWISALAAVANLIVYATNQDVAYLISAILVPAVFIPLALWSRTSPFEAILSALILYITLIAAAATVNPASIFQGVILKIIIIGALVKGVKAGYDSKKIWNELKQRHWTQEF